jgi:uncharacterized FlgJ-related protein
MECKEYFCNKNGHIKTHMEEKEHSLYIDLKKEEIFCNICKDFVIFYDEEEKKKLFLNNFIFKNKFNYFTKIENFQNYVIGFENLGNLIF